MRGRSRTLISTAMAYGPAVFWIVLALWKFGPTRGFVPVMPLVLMVGIGIRRWWDRRAVRRNAS